MRLYPAIDIKEGHCVRLKQGLFNEKIVYAQDLAFNQNQIVSSDRILLNITTNTPLLVQQKSTTFVVHR